MQIKKKCKCFKVFPPFIVSINILYLLSDLTTKKTPQKTRGCLFIKIKCSPIPMAYTVKPALKGTSI